MPQEPPYRLLARGLARGLVIPFLGAGASLVNRPAGSKWDQQTSPFPPLGFELSQWLADGCGFPSKDERLRAELARVASFYQFGQAGRADLRDDLRTIFIRDYDPGPLHRYLAANPTALLIITTNYDCLIEKAFEEAKRPYHLLVYPTERMSAAGMVLWRKADEWEKGFQECPMGSLGLDCNPAGDPIIYKMHGTVDPADEKNDQFVITEEDYVAFLSRMTSASAIPKDFFLPMQQRRFLFLGYGLGDWNFRVLLRQLNEIDINTGQGAEKLHWAIQRTVDPIEELLWSRQNVNIGAMDLSQFIERLKNPP